MSISDFRSSINNKGVIKTNKFEARFTLRDGHYLKDSPFVNERLLTVRCDSATLPGVAFASADGPSRLGYGPVEKRPYMPLFDDLTLTFMVDAGSQVHKIFYEWVNCIVNMEGKGAVELGTARAKTKAVAYEVGYRDSYDSTLELLVYRDTGQRAMTFTAYNVFPMGFPQIGMNWNEGDILRLSIPFAYTDFKVSYNDFAEPTDPKETGTVDNTIQGVTLNTIRDPNIPASLRSETRLA